MNRAIPLAVLLKAQAALAAVHQRPVDAPLALDIGLQVAIALGAMNAYVNVMVATLPPVEVSA